jgi:hypothetical protein
MRRVKAAAPAEEDVAGDQAFRVELLRLLAGLGVEALLTVPVESVRPVTEPSESNS